MQAFVTQQQIGFIKTLCDELDRTLEGAAQELFGLPFGQLDRAQASEMIDALLAANQNRRKQKAAERNEYYESTRTGWVRCNTRRPCDICGRKKYCSTTADGIFAVCTKEAAGSFLETGKGHYVHRLLASSPAFTVTRPALVIKSAPKLSPAEHERRTVLFNAVYSALIQLSPSTAATPQLVTGAKGLAERGLDTDADYYGMIPGPYVERLALTRRIIERLEATRPPELGTDDYVRAVLRTPGFWKDGYNQITLWLSDNHDAPVLLIPYRDAQGRIQGCQLRLPNAPKDRRYQWLSSVPFAQDGPSPGAPIHFVQSSLVHTSAPRKNLITEGALKGDAVGKFLTAYTITTTSGVTCSHPELIAAAARITQGAEPVVIAFDKDHRTNEQVCRQISRLITGLLNEGLNPQVLVWGGRAKGLDDALLAPDRQETKYRLLKPAAWITGLPKRVKKEATKPLLQIEAHNSELRRLAETLLAQIEAQAQSVRRAA